MTDYLLSPPPPSMFRSVSLCRVRVPSSSIARRYGHHEAHEAAGYSKNLDLPAIKGDPYAQFGKQSHSREHEVLEIASAQSNSL